MTGSNRRPLACKASALPAELILRNNNRPSEDNNNYNGFTDDFKMIFYTFKTR